MSDSVIIDLPFSYTVTGVPPRCRTETTAIYKEMLPVSIPQFTSSDCPANLWIRDNVHGIQETYRVRNDIPYQPVILPWERSHDGRRVASLSALRRFLQPGDHLGRTWDRYPLPLAKKAGWTVVHLKHPDRSEENMRRIVHDGRDEALNAALLAASRLMVVDDVLYAPAPEPVWVVRKHDRTCTITAEPLIERDYSTHRFRADRFEDAMRIAICMARPPRGEVLVRSEIVGQAGWTYDAVPDLLANVEIQLTQILTGNDAPAAHLLDPRFFHHWHRFRASIAAPDQASWDLETAADAIAQMHSVLAVRHPDAEVLARSIRMALVYRDWRLRNIERPALQSAHTVEDEEVLAAVSLGSP